MMICRGTYTTKRTAKKGLIETFLFPGYGLFGLTGWSATPSCKKPFVDKRISRIRRSSREDSLTSERSVVEEVEYCRRMIM
jgi:hypothetical protein